MLRSEDRNWTGMGTLGTLLEGSKGPAKSMGQRRRPMADHGRFMCTEVGQMCPTGA